MLFNKCAFSHASQIKFPLSYIDMALPGLDKHHGSHAEFSNVFIDPITALSEDCIQWDVCVGRVTIKILFFAYSRAEKDT